MVFYIKESEITRFFSAQPLPPPGSVRGSENSFSPEAAVSAPCPVLAFVVVITIIIIVVIIFK